jgi:L-fucose mutarotase
MRKNKKWWGSTDLSRYYPKSLLHHYKKRPIMLKGIPSILSPELLKILMEMGHGDEIVIVDGNFPAASTAQHLVRSDGNGSLELLDAILQLLPLDKYVDQPAALMAVVPGDPIDPQMVWDGFKQVVTKWEPEFGGFEFVERFAFYERAKKAYAIVASSETAQYANIILKKGIVKG